jgi:hypothetical protein
MSLSGSGGQESKKVEGNLVNADPISSATLHPLSGAPISGSVRQHAPATVHENLRPPPQPSVPNPSSKWAYQIMSTRPSHEAFRAAAPNFLHFQQLIRDSDWARSSLPYIKSFLEILKTEAATTKSLRDECEKRFNRHRGTDHQSHGNPFSKAWHRYHNRSGGEMGEEERRELEQLRNANRQLNDQMDKVNDAKTLYHECVRAIEANDRAKGDLKALLERLFSLSAPSSYPSERAIEQSLKEERTKANKLEQTKSHYVITIPSLRQALTQIQSAFKMLEEALEYCGDYEGRISNHWPADLDKANWHRAKAARIISEVLKYDQSIPRLCDVDLGSYPYWSSPTNEDAIDDVVEVKTILQEPARMLEGDVFEPLIKEASSLDEELRESQVNICKLEASLFGERTRIMTEVLANEGGLKSLEEEVRSDKPPPAYSDIVRA